MLFAFLMSLSIGLAWSSPWLGFSFKPQGNNPCTLDVVGMHPESAASKGGIMVGDLVLRLNGKPIQSIDALKARMKTFRAGERISVGLLRGSKTLELKMTLTERPDDIRSLMGSHVGSKAYPLGQHFYANEGSRKQAPHAILLDFWATWCGPCRASIPMLRNIYRKYEARGFELIGISSDQLPALQDFQKMEKEPWPLYHDVGSQQSSRWGVRAIPTMLLLNGDWVVVRQWQGPPSPDELDAEVRKLIGKK